jgi:Cu/Ag efflux protein CusF
MQKQMSKIAVGLLIAVLFAASLFAGTKTQRLEGTIKTKGSDYVTMETKAHQIVTVKMTSATKFFKQKKASTFSEMKTGDHVVFLATPTSDTSSTNTPSSNTPSTYTPSATNTKKDSLSLGLSFSAVQASY